MQQRSSLATAAGSEGADVGEEEDAARDEEMALMADQEEMRGSIEMMEGRPFVNTLDGGEPGSVPPR